MHALIIAQYFPPDFGGASTRAYNAAKGLITQGCKVTVISAFPHYPHGKVPDKYRGKVFVKEEVEGIELIRTWIPSLPHSSISNRARLHFSFMVSCMFVITQIEKFDIVFAMNPNLFSFFPAWFYALIHNKKIIRNVDDLWPEVFYELGIVKSAIAKKILDSLAHLSYQKSCAIIPVSRGYVQTIISKYHISERKITVLEHGVNTSIFNRIESPNNNPKIVMYSGAITIGYDFDSVIRAANILESQSVRFIIRGTGELIPIIKQKIKENRIRNIEVRTEILPIKELVSTLNSADIFLLPMSSVGAIDQGLPTKILEYQALGKPIICCSNGEAGKYIASTFSGLVIPANEPDKLAESIMRLISDEKLARQLGKNGFDNVHSHLTLEIIGKRLVEIIRKCQESNC